MDSAAEEPVSLVLKDPFANSAHNTRAAADNHIANLADDSADDEDIANSAVAHNTNADDSEGTEAADLKTYGSPFLFRRNRYPLASLLSGQPFITDFLNDMTTARKPWTQSVLRKYIEQNKNNFLLDELLKTLVDEVDINGVYVDFLKDILSYEDFSLDTRRNVKLLCHNSYSPPVPRRLMNVIRNRSEKDQLTLMKIAGISLMSIEEDTDIKPAQERAVSRWILKNQRDREYWANCDEKGFDYRAILKMEFILKQKAKMDLLTIKPNVVRIIREETSGFQREQLITKMSRDIGVSHDRLSVDLIRNWLLRAQYQNKITEPLDNDIAIVKNVMSEINPTRWTRVECEDDTEYRDRLKSFGLAWKIRHPNQTPHALADTGMYLRRLEEKRPPENDQVACFCCGLHLQNWKSNDEPALEHMWWSPRCSFLHQQHGKKITVFVEKLKELSTPKPKSLAYIKDMYRQLDPVRVI